MGYNELCESIGGLVCRIENAGKYSIEKIQINEKYRHYAGNYINNLDQITMFMGYPCEFVDFSDEVELNYCIYLKPVSLN